MALRLIRALPGERRLLSPLSAGYLPQNRRHGRGARTTRLRRTPQASRPAASCLTLAASIASRPNVSVTIANVPQRAGCAYLLLICVRCQQLFYVFRKIIVRPGALAEPIKGLHRGQRRRPHFGRGHARAIEAAAKSERADARRPIGRQIFIRHAADGTDDGLLPGGPRAAR